MRKFDQRTGLASQIQQGIKPPPQNGYELEHTVLEFKDIFWRLKSLDLTYYNIVFWTNFATFLKMKFIQRIW